MFNIFPSQVMSEKPGFLVCGRAGTGDRDEALLAA
jgi:hypothetical protein